MCKAADSTHFTMTRRVHFSETDRAGVLYFAHYYRFMEEAEHAFWRSLGFRVITEVDGQETSWPRVATSCEYFAPVRFDDELELAFRVVGVGNRSASYEVEFRCEGRRIALGRMTAVYCTIVDGEFQPTPLPGFLRVRLEGTMGPS
jgi:4-hydroxybenzoyl-CoA thioesterase/acyl-CoA thioester hydrolase